MTEHLSDPLWQHEALVTLSEYARSGDKVREKRSEQIRLKFESVKDRLDDVHQPASADIRKKLNLQVKGAIAPSMIHDFLVNVTVFQSSPEKTVEVLKLWFDPLGPEVLAKWLDLTNVASASKKSYGHEIMLQAAAHPDPLHYPLMRYLNERGYLGQQRSRRGPLSSILETIIYSENPCWTSGRIPLMIEWALEAEKACPGSCITQDATESFVNSPVREEILQISTRVGLDLRQWAVDSKTFPDWAQHLENVQRSIDAGQAARAAVVELAQVRLSSARQAMISD